MMLLIASVIYMYTNVAERKYMNISQGLRGLFTVSSFPKPFCPQMSLERQILKGRVKTDPEEEGPRFEP